MLAKRAQSDTLYVLRQGALSDALAVHERPNEGGTLELMQESGAISSMHCVYTVSSVRPVN